MPNSAVRKNKIVLSDYNYRRDIENRLLMSNLTVFEVEVLKEIVHHSLKFSISSLAEQVGVSTTTLKETLQKLGGTKLFRLDASTIHVDKEMRKYYEAQLEKFEEDFKPDLDFIQSLLNKVPIHILPVWYAIPRGADHIFSSIIEKCLLTPKVYKRYLEELQFDQPILKDIIRDVYTAPDFRVSSSELIKKYNLSRETFEEHLLLLEYSFVCYLSYSKEGDEWTEVVTPFYEWMEYLQFEKCSTPSSIEAEKEIKKNPASKAKISKKLSESILYTPRNLHEVEKSLARVLQSGWVYTDDFLKGFTGAIGDKEPVTLKNRGKRWRYTLPIYNEEELDFIKRIIHERFFQQGFVSTGVHEGRNCFCVTHLGRISIHH